MKKLAILLACLLALISCTSSQKKEKGIKEAAERVTDNTATKEMYSILEEAWGSQKTAEYICKNVNFSNCEDEFADKVISKLESMLSPMVKDELKKLIVVNAVNDPVWACKYLPKGKMEELCLKHFNKPCIKDFVLYLSKDSVLISNIIKKLPDSVVVETWIYYLKDSSRSPTEKFISPERKQNLIKKLSDEQIVYYNLGSIIPRERMWKIARNMKLRKAATFFYLSGVSNKEAKRLFQIR